MIKIINDTTYIDARVAIYGEWWFVPAVILALVIYYCAFKYPRLKRSFDRLPPYYLASEDGVDGLLEYIGGFLTIASYCFYAPMSELVVAAKKFHKECMPTERLKCVFWIVHQLGFEVVVYRLDREEEADEYLRSIGAEDVRTYKPTDEDLEDFKEDSKEYSYVI